MIVAVMMGKGKSLGFPGKNVFPVLGKPMMVYPLSAALGSRLVDRTFVTTDDAQIASIAQDYGAEIIDRPAHLCTTDALGEDVFVHAYNWVKENVSKDIKAIVLLMCNAATITSAMIDEGVQVLLDNEEIDSAVSVSQYNMWSPLRARKLDEKGLLKPFVPFEAYGDPSKLSDNRDSQGDVYFADMGTSIVRPRCIENIKDGLLPQRWMGQKIHPLKQWGGFDVDYQWQIPTLEYWLKEHKVSVEEPKVRK